MGNFSLLCEAFEKAGLSRLLGGIDVQVENEIITLYAPINTGMIAAGYTSESIASMSTSKLEDMLKFHITRGSVTAVQLVCGDHQSTLLGGASSINIECRETNGFTSKIVTGFFNDETNTPTILSPNDIELCNGMVQPLDHVMKMLP